LRNPLAGRRHALRKTAPAHRADADAIEA
jgi:hypothetical protein